MSNAKSIKLICLISVNKIFDDVLSLITEAVKTSSFFLSHMLHLLASHPEIQQRCFDEIEEKLKLHGNDLTFDAIQDMTYMDYVICGKYKR